MEYVLKVENLYKNFDNQSVLNNINFNLEKGEILGLIGKNGSGKTTLLNILLAYKNKSSGEYHWNNSIKSEKISNMISTPEFYDYMTGYENLLYFCKLKENIDLKKIDEVLDLVNMKGAKNKKFKKYSLGMKQRLGFALSLINEPEVMILDEPFNGIDPEGIYELSNLISELNKNKNITIIMSSHVLEDLYRLCSRFIILNDGHIIKDLSKEKLDLSLDSKFIITLNLDERYKTKFIKKFGENNILFDKSRVMIISNVITYNNLINWMREENIDFLNAKEEEKTLNELFIEMIGGK